MLFGHELYPIFQVSIWTQGNLTFKMQLSKTWPLECYFRKYFISLCQASISFFQMCLKDHFIQGVMTMHNDLRGHSTTMWTRRGGGGSEKIHACPPRGRDVHVDQKFKSSYIRKYFLYHCFVHWISEQVHHWKFKLWPNLPTYHAV